MADPDVPVPAAAKSKLVPILLVVNCVLLAGIGALVLRKGEPAHEAGGGGEGAEAAAAAAKGKAKEAVAADAMGPTVKLSDFVLQLRDPNGEKYARVSFEIEVNTEPERDNLAQHLPKIRDAFISYLADRTVDELRGSENLDHTKTALRELIGQRVPSARIRALYVTDLVLQ